MIVLSIIVGLSCCIDNSDALDYESNKINFNPDEVRVVRSSVELEPLTTISSGEKIYVYEKTGYTNYKINGNDTDKDNFIVSAALRDSGVVITTEKKSYRIDFNTDDTYGTTPPSQIGITIGSITTIPEASFSKTGYTMIGWLESHPHVQAVLDHFPIFIGQVLTAFLRVYHCVDLPSFFLR